MNKYQFWSVLLFSAFLTACTNTQSVLNVENNTAATTITTPATGTDTTAVANTQTARSLYIAPIIGAPVNVVTPLTQRLNQTAQARGLTLTSSENDPSTLILKGYFSALADGGHTSVLYVWDVLDPAGNRLHRIQGEQQVQDTSTDSWGAVTPNAMEAIADQTIQQYQTWKNSSGL